MQSPRWRTGAKKSARLQPPDRTDELARRQTPGVRSQLGGDEHAFPRTLRARVLANEASKQLLAAPVQPARACEASRPISQGNFFMIVYLRTELA